MSFRDFSSNLPLARLAEFSLPKKVIFGTGAAESVGTEAKNLKGKNITIITDQGIKKAGLADKILDFLKKEKLSAEIFDNISAEPTVESVKACVKAVREGSYDLVIGVGGGSVVDQAKLAAASLTNPGDVMELVNPAKDMIKVEPKPKILIPTTSGTGSEVTPYAVVVKEMYKTWAASPKIFADVALVDPLMTITCPPKQTTYSALDALAHNLEGLISNLSNPISDGQALKGVELVFKYARTANHIGEDLEARWGLSCASMLGGFVIGYPWVGGPAILGHCIAEAAGPRWGIPHGAACGLALPYIIQYNLPACMDKLAEVAKVTGTDVYGLSTREAAQALIKEILILLKDLDMPISLKEWAVPKNELQEFSEYIFITRQHEYGLPSYNPRKLTKESTLKLLEQMYEGEVTP